MVAATLALVHAPDRSSARHAPSDRSIAVRAASRSIHAFWMTHRYVPTSQEIPSGASTPTLRNTLRSLLTTAFSAVSADGGGLWCHNARITSAFETGCEDRDIR